jgi:hypothetical protein
MDSPNNERRKIFDPTTADMLSNMEQRVRESHLPQPEKSRLVRERARLKKRRVNQIALDLPEGLKPLIIDYAEREGIPISQLVVALLILGLEQYIAGQLSFWGFKKPSRCPRFEFVVDLENWKKQFK